MSPAELDPHRFLGEWHEAGRTAIVESKLEALSRGLRDGDSDLSVIAAVGNGIRASEAVAAALWAFVRYGADPVATYRVIPLHRCSSSPSRFALSPTRPCVGQTRACCTIAS